ncbi:MAG TPA: adenylate/guanylate cyclase domain-containing protein [Thermoleophilaceae bacterium]|nr:adenylate/guanylate cyclase domain-containing protein [Thermoleophilaceae bacterium]
MTTDEHTFLFADLSGYTALTEVHGDEDAADLVTRFVDDVRAELPGYGAEEVKTIGDAVMIRADDPERAVRLAISIVHDVGRRHGFPSVRVGVHTGPAVERDGDWFGAAVNLAARVSGAAAGGEVLLTAATAERIAGDRGTPRLFLRPRGRRELRNVSEPVELIEALCEFSRSLEDLPIDPVCRMAVEPDHAAGSLSYEGAEYWFCSLDCVQKFAASPEHYR